ncbi:MAG: AI-2E family transporter [Chlamydiota bacterium]
MWYHKESFRNLVSIVLFLLAVYIAYTLLPLIDSVLGFLLAIFSPFVLAVILYYLFRPLVNLLNCKISINLSITIVYLIIGLLVFLVLVFAFPTIQEQVKVLKSIDLQKVASLDLTTIDIFHVKINLSDEMNKMTSRFLGVLNTLLIGHFSDFISFLTQFVITLAITPFILYYLLKDDHSVYSGLINLVPQKYVTLFDSFSSDVDSVILHFVNGRMIVSLVINLAIFLCFLVIGLDFALVLTLISTVFYIIPTFGSFLAMILPLIVGFSTSTIMGVEVLLIMGVAMTLEGFLVTPQVMGRKLTMHPLTVILVLLAAGSLYGIFGMLFATPAYAIVKSFLTHLYFQLQPEETKET